MAVLVSHAMHRFPPTLHDSGYSNGYDLRSEPTSGNSTQSTYEGERGALSRSMRYAEPWLYGGSVRGAPTGIGGFLLTPALILCQCADYLNGTTRSRSSKKSPHTCKKCKGTRLPLNSLDSKFGTVRCYPTHHQTSSSTPLRAGTVRMTSSSSRASILPTTADPYDLMRRSRLSVPEGSTADFRDLKDQSKIKSPTGKNNTTHADWGEDVSQNGTKKEANNYNSTFGRRSILECSVNPYDLMSLESKSSRPESLNLKGKEVKNVTVLNGQRVKVRPSVENTFQNYEDIESPKTPFGFLKSGNKVKSPTRNQVSIPPKSKSLSPEKYSDFDGNTATRSQFKSILKKSPGYYSDVELPSRDYEENSFSPARKANARSKSSGSQFYLPTPLPISPRKKVQFCDAKECLSAEDSGQDSSSSGIEDMQETSSNDEEHYCDLTEYKKEEMVKILGNDSKVSNSEEGEDDVFEDALEQIDKEEINDENKDKHIKKKLTLQRSLSDRSKKEILKNVIFHDTMALRGRSRPSLNLSFSDEELKKLDGLTSRIRTPTPKPSNAPPPPPPSSNLQKDNGQLTDSKVFNEYPVEIGSPNKGTIATPSFMFDQKDRHKRSPKIENVDIQTPPSAPPRKKSGNKQPSPTAINFQKCDSIQMERPVSEDHEIKSEKSPTNTVVKINQDFSNSQIIPKNNKTVVQISSPPTIHKIQIKNEFSDVNDYKDTIFGEGGQRKTSILINGDGDCYCTVNVNDNVPLYQSSVVVNDSGSTSKDEKNKVYSKVYITGAFTPTKKDSFGGEEVGDTKQYVDMNNAGIINDLSDRFVSEINTIVPKEVAKEIPLKDTRSQDSETDCEIPSALSDDKEILQNVSNNVLSSSPRNKDTLNEILRNPVEAVRQNLVPHICGKSDMTRRSQKINSPSSSFLNSPKVYPKFSILPESDSIVESSSDKNSLEESFLRLRTYESIGDEVSSEHSNSTQYEPMDLGSDCYTDHSNRSSVTEEELANRNKFYELLADSDHVEISENEDHHYESIKVNNDPIYEEIEIPPPLPSNPPPASLLDDLHLDKEYTTRSIFEGASKYDILSYLVDAKERGIVQEDGYAYTLPAIPNSEEDPNSSEDNSLIISGAIVDDKANFQKPAEVERNDSGVGSETSKSSLSKYRTKQEVLVCCEDCDYPLESRDNEPLLCKKCMKKRSERKEIITEIVETEEKYSKDLQIILEEFYQPMLVAGLLTPDQLSAIFLNVEDLLENSQALAERLRDAVEIAQEQGDDDLLTVNIGKLFLEAAPMLHAFETYCVRQGTASLLLASLEKEKELLRIFLRVSQMENTLLRRMNLNSFLMVPVQRVTKYPLLLARLYKVTPGHYETKDLLKEAQHKIELHLNHMNSETKDVPSKLWRRIGSSSGRRPSTEMDLVNIKLRKIAVDVLEWNHDEAKFVMEGKLLFTQPTDNYWRKGRTIKLTHINALLVTNGKALVSKPAEKPQEENCLVFSKHSGVREAALLLVRDKNGRYSLLRDPLYLDKCIIAADPAWQSYFEVQEVMGKDTFIFKAEDDVQTQLWYKHLQYHAQGLGAWRKRRNALANIMINGMGLRS